MGPWAAPAVPALIEAMQDEDWANRCNVIEVLGEVGPEAAAATPALVKTLQNDEHHLVRSHAAEALGKIGGTEAVPVLMSVLEKGDDSVRSDAARALGRIGDSRAVPALIAALDDGDESANYDIVSALRALGHKAKAAVPALVRLVENDKANGWIAAQALGAVDADGIGTPVLIEALGNADFQTRRSAAIGLGRIGRKAGAAERALHERLQDGDPRVRIAAAGALWSVSGKADAPVRVLRSVLQAPEEWPTTWAAADALAEIGPAARAAVPDLTACLASDTRYVVTSSATALGKIGPGAASAVPALTARLDDSDDHYTSICIARALWRINRSKRSEIVLLDTLKQSRDPMAVSEAAELVDEMDPQPKQAVPLLRSLLKDGDSSIRDAAAKALERN